MIAEIDHRHLVFQDRDPLRLVELAELRAEATPLEDEFSVGVELLDAIGSGVGDIHVVGRVKRQVEGVDEFARALLAVGIRRGDRVALLVTNRTEWIVAAFAAAKVGATVAAVSTFSTPRELAWTLEHSGAAALVTLSAFRGRRFLDALRDLCPELDGSAPGALTSARLPSLHTVVALEGRAAAAVFSLPQFLARGATVDVATLAAAQQAVTPEDICYILYTSGSTAAPKGVTLAHGPLIANGFDIG